MIVKGRGEVGPLRGGGVRPPIAGETTATVTAPELLQLKMTRRMKIKIGLRLLPIPTIIKFFFSTYCFSPQSFLSFSYAFAFCPFDPKIKRMSLVTCSLMYVLSIAEPCRLVIVVQYMLMCLWWLIVSSLLSLEVCQWLLGSESCNLSSEYLF
jgi:hypothetical protein